MSNACETKIWFKYKTRADAEKAAKSLNSLLDTERKKGEPVYDGHLICNALFPKIGVFPDIDDIIPDCASTVKSVEVLKDGKTVAMGCEDRDTPKTGFWKTVFDVYFPGSEMSYTAVEPDMWLYERWDPEQKFSEGECVARGSVFGDGWASLSDRIEFEDILKKSGLFEEPGRADPEYMWIHDEVESATEILEENGEEGDIKAGEWGDLRPSKCAFGRYKEAEVLRSRQTVWADGRLSAKLGKWKINLDAYLEKSSDRGGK